MKALKSFTVAALTLIGFCGGAVLSRAQGNSVRWSVFDAGFAVSISRSTNSAVLSTVGQTFVGPARNAGNWIDTGFLVDALLRGTATSVADNGRTDLPLTYELSQNYPNPFNPSTLIRFTIPERTHVSLHVYDVLGREVAALVDEEKTPGVYEVRFDARSLSSGAYFYRLKTNSYIQLKKLLIVR
jgi:hypothetical protein